MNFDQMIGLANAVAWPIVGLVALIYIWSSDAVKSLIQISGSVAELRKQMRELVEAEERIRAAIGSFSEHVEAITQIQTSIFEIKAELETVRDNVDVRSGETSDDAHGIVEDRNSLESLFADILKEWQILTDGLEAKFGYFDKRSTGGEAYRFAHRNRKGARLTYDQAAEIARLHSSFKSYTRRQTSLEDWLDKAVRDEFVNSVRAASEAIRQL